MLFNSLEFIYLFLPITLVGFFLLGRLGQYRSAMAWLVLASWVFYGYWNPVYLLLLGASIVLNYSWGLWLSDRQSHRKALLIIGVAANLATLGYFKYANFFVDSLNDIPGISIELAPVVLPLAISFFTFQQIAYLVDTYQRKTEEHNFLHYCLFVSFFPQLIAGPIVHHKDVLPQFIQKTTYRPKLDNLIDGGSIFMLGLFKKVVIADQLARYAVPVFDAADGGVTFSLFEAWAGLLAYAFQLYFDFSGYSDMAIGLGLMFGIRLPQNFDSPYKALNIADYWRRWHMTLSAFLRAYVYIPLGGNKRGEVRRYINLFMTLFLGGIWHGAGWNYFLWGALHGFYVAFNHAWSQWHQRMFPNLKIPGAKFIAWSITFFFITLGWVLFRPETLAGSGILWGALWGEYGIYLPSQIVNALPFLAYFADPVQTLPLLAGGTMLGLVEMCGMLAIAAAIALLMPNLYQLTPRQRIWLLIPCIGFLIQALFFGRAPSEFLYFQF